MKYTDQHQCRALKLRRLQLIPLHLQGAERSEYRNGGFEYRVRPWWLLRSLRVSVFQFQDQPGKRRLCEWLHGCSDDNARKSWLFEENQGWHVLQWHSDWNSLKINRSDLHLLPGIYFKGDAFLSWIFIGKTSTNRIRIASFDTVSKGYLFESIPRLCLCAGTNFGM